MRRSSVEFEVKKFYDLVHGFRISAAVTGRCRGEIRLVGRHRGVQIRDDG